MRKPPLYRGYLGKAKSTPKPLARQSPQRSRDNAKYRHLKVKFLESHPYCEKCNDAIEPRFRSLHHWAGRTNELLCWVPGFRMLCLACHNWVETHRNDACQLGLRAPDNLFGRPSKVIPKGETYTTRLDRLCRADANP